MADNHKPNIGNNITYASDDIGGVTYPRVKLVVGDDGVASDVSSSLPLPIESNTIPTTPVALTGSNQIVSASATTYHGLTVSETSATLGASLYLYNNAVGASGTIVESVTLSANESKSINVSNGVTASEGLYAVVSGSVQGSVRLIS